MADPVRITQARVAQVRATLAAEQGGRCGICKGVLGTGSKLPVLDHDHSTGAVRGVLCRGCNALFGKVENNAARYGVIDRIIQFCAGLAGYIRKHETNITGLLHPTFKTADEKRLARNAKARKATAAKRKEKETA